MWAACALLWVFRLDGVVVDYSVTVLVDGARVSTDQLEHLTLQSNRVENSYREAMEPPEVEHSAREVTEVITEELEGGKTHTHTHTDRHTHTYAHRHTHTHTQRETHTHTETHTDRHTHTQTQTPPPRHH